jgi:hypothetical protein
MAMPHLRMRPEVRLGQGRPSQARSCPEGQNAGANSIADARPVEREFGRLKNEYALTPIRVRIAKSSAGPPQSTPLNRRARPTEPDVERETAVGVKATA